MVEDNGSEGGRPAERGGGERGPAEHRTRVQLLEAADAHFRHYGYAKTTVADLARAIGVSPAYVYRFFESKQAIGEAICAMTLDRIAGSLRAVAAEPRSAADRLRRLYRIMVDRGVELYFQERRLHEIVIAAVEGDWSSIMEYRREIDRIVRVLLISGREAGEFERKTPLDDLTVAIACTMAPFCHPILLQQTEREPLKTNAEQVANLVLRSLAP
jgi:AcrR family transcriptional regulator